jgi:hypothetical protein
MDYGKVLSRAWQITWRWKALWILGFLAGLGQGGGGGGGGGNATASLDSDDWSRWGIEISRFEFLPEVVGLLVAVACLAILVGIALWVISTMARGGLIAGVRQVEEEGSTTFLSAWRVGRDRFWTLFGIGILAGLPILIMVVALIVAVIAMFTGAGFAFEASNAAGGLGIAGSILCGGTFCCGVIIVAIILSQIQIYADRAAILENLGWIDAFKRGWDVLRNNIGPTLVFWIIFLAIGLVFVVIIMAALAPVVLPAFAIFGNFGPDLWIVAPICFGGLLAIIIGALINSIVTTFSSATWTLAYREMTGATAEPAVEVAAE